MRRAAVLWDGRVRALFRKASPACESANPGARTFYKFRIAPGRACGYYFAEERQSMRLLLATCLLCAGGIPWITSAYAQGIPGGVTIQALAVDPTNSAVLFAGTSSGLYQSLDAGKTWSEIALEQDDITGVAIAPDAPCTLYVGIDSNLINMVVPGIPPIVMTPNSGGNLRKSLDCGASWSVVFGQPYRAVLRMAVTWEPSPTVVASVSRNAPGGPGVALTLNDIVRYSGTTMTATYNFPGSPNFAVGHAVATD